jgi:hypothetical protein
MGGFNNQLKRNLTPGFNQLPSPMSPQGQAQNAPTLSPNSGIQAKNAQSSRGLLGSLGSMLQNPGFIQALAGIAMSQGKYGGARGKGMMDQMNLNRQMQLEEEKVREANRIANDRTAIDRQREEREAKADKIGTLSSAVKLSDALEIPLEDALGTLNVTDYDPNQVSRVSEAIKRRAQQQWVWIDQESKEIVPPDPNNPNLIRVSPTKASSILKELRKPEPALYINSQMKVLSAPDVRELERQTGKKAEELGLQAIDAANAVTLAGQMNRPEPREDTGAIEREAKSGALFNKPFTQLTPQQKDRVLTSLRTPIPAPSEDAGTVIAGDPDSNAILAQTRLSPGAFAWLTGNAGSLPRDRVTRARAMREAQEWSIKNGVDTSTMAAQYKAYNEVLIRNINRVNNTKIMEQELQATIDNLIPVVNDKELKNLRINNVVDIWAGKEVNDPLAQQYAMHLSQLRTELAGYNAAAQGRSGNEITVQDEKQAEAVIKDGISKGGLRGLSTAIDNSTKKMAVVLERSVDTARKSVWDLFGVGDRYKSKVPPRTPPTNNTSSDLSKVPTDELLKQLISGAK